jgi:hypothetical protein
MPAPFDKDLDQRRQWWDEHLWLQMIAVAAIVVLAVVIDPRWKPGRLWSESRRRAHHRPARAGRRLAGLVCCSAVSSADGRTRRLNGIRDAAETHRWPRPDGEWRG